MASRAVVTDYEHVSVEYRIDNFMIDDGALVLDITDGSVVIYADRKWDRLEAEERP